MAEPEGWQALRERRMREPGAAAAYDATRLAFELGSAVRQLREDLAWTQSRLAAEAGMTQSAVARFEAGGTVPTLPVLGRLAAALGADLSVNLVPHGTHAA